MSTETSVTNLKINKLTKAQYDTITPSATEAYELTDLSNILDAKADDSSVVHKAGSETITGFKTFTNKAKITSSTSGAILELESGASNTNFLLKRTGGSTCVLESGTTVGLFGTQSNHSLQIRTNYETRMTFDTSGNVTLAKAPSSDSNSKQVATTAWTISKIPTNNNQLTNGAGYITGITSSDVTTALGYNPVNPSSLATVATSGDYDDLTNKPTIPSEVTESTVSGWGFTKNTGTVTSVNNISPVNGNVSLTIPDTSNLANKDLSNLSSTGDAKFQEPLVSGTNIKTVNGNSLLGSGDLTIQGGGGLSYSATCPAITISSGIASWSITHNLGTQDVVAILYNSSGQENDKNVVINSNNQITVSWKASSNVSAGDYKIVVLASGASSVNTFYDGQWVAASNTIASSASTTGVDYDLSNYLPDDNYSYEILLYGQININVSNGSYRNLCVKSSILTGDYSICATRQASSTIATTTGTVIMAIGTNRKLTVTERTNDKGTYSLWLRGYRRIGTNA